MDNGIISNQTSPTNPQKKKDKNETGLKPQKANIHSVWFIRDSQKLRLVLSLNFFIILTSSVPYVSLNFLANFNSLVPYKLMKKFLYICRNIE